MPTLAIKTIGGKQAGEVTASERVFAARVNIPLMHQAVKAEMENRRQDTRNAPGRGDMFGGGRKPFKQKGTGRARRVTTSNPQHLDGILRRASRPVIQLPNGLVTPIYRSPKEYDIFSGGSW